MITTKIIGDDRQELVFRSDPATRSAPKQAHDRPDRRHCDGRADARRAEVAFDPTVDYDLEMVGDS